MGLGIPDTWDVLIIGDGAGCWWDLSCGWGCILADHHFNRRRAFKGSMSGGTIAIAELMPTIHGLLWYSEFHGHATKVRLGRGTINVHVVTDNETTVKHWSLLSKGGQAAYKIRKKRPLWSVLLQLERAGYILHFHWVPRGTVGLQILADEVAGIARNTIAAFNLKPRNGVARDLNHEIYNINPNA
jgi:hypothetical protein